MEQFVSTIIGLASLLAGLALGTWLHVYLGCKLTFLGWLASSAATLLIASEFTPLGETETRVAFLISWGCALALYLIPSIDRPVR